MRRLIALVLVIGLVGGGVYVYLFQQDEAIRFFRGYKRAETPQVAADMFKKAIKERRYNMAAFYCTTGYAEQLNRGAAAATKFGTAIDELTYQMKERSLMRDEVKIVFQALDPFLNDLEITVSKESGDTAEAALVFADPSLSGNNPTSGTWNLKPEIFQVFTRSMKFPKPSTAVVPMKKENGEWKFDFPSDKALQLRVGYLNDKHKNYVNPLEIVTQEVKNAPETRENTTVRLKGLLESAAKE